ncbi:MULTISPECIES: hypothetical protein [Nocardia]|uniref:hypothetical protein n=1 Tax=Nocardia TaxID=1817 RepID=UPI0007E94115|nr:MULTISPECIES: hypothetical protein [Nocardia]MBF6275099.1 hypothetical protein [Nocardia nova]OBA55019.1 hypothetical protein A5789_01075 [Nocardia sp. 852002-51101_SCH5132738]OBB37866.1 hypothetical protein A5748_03040 [Nocardia sp. 852002-51244_SCH5132740]OBF67310.1 hypothetical protein A9X06_01025 [Mycobacterium sp. 852002-51759_SCH5129042]
MTDSPQSAPRDTGEGGERRPESRPGQHPTGPGRPGAGTGEHPATPGGPEMAGATGYPQFEGTGAPQYGASRYGGAPGEPPPVTPGGVPPVASGAQGQPGPTYGPPGSVPPGAYPPPADPTWGAPDNGMPPQGTPGYGAPQGYPGGPGYAAAPGLNIGRALSFAWDRFRANPIPWVAITLVGFVAYLMVTVVVNVTHMNSLMPVMLIGLLAAVVVWLLQAAMIRGALYETDGTPPDFASFFGFVNAGNVLITALLVFVAACVGAVLCILPALIVGYLCMFSLHYVIDQDLDPFSAIKASVQLVVSNFVPTLLLALTVAALTIVATALCGIGLLVVGPLTVIAVTYSYRMLTGGLIA